ncbi:MAG: 5-histidylcysteine sulfoxide synthase [Pseudomonadota bacterium]
MSPAFLRMTAMLAERFPQTSTCFSRSPDLQGPTPDAVRAAIRQYFVATFDRYEQLFEVLTCDEAYYTKPISLRHPLIFYFGHTATFFINKLLLARLLSQRINPRFESLFAVGVDEMSWDDLNDAHYDWPAVAEVKAYRDQVRAAVLNVIDQTPLSLPIDWQNPWWAVIMGIEHERIHLETSSVLMRQHALDFVKTHAAWQPCRDTGAAPANRLLPVAAGEVVLGKTFNDAIYGWDNEYGQHRAQVPTFEASQYLVSNQEYLGFVEAGGYREDRYWSEEGLNWRNYARAEHPTFWLRSNDGNDTSNGWQLRLMAEVVAMPWDWPAEVNCLEAQAFCRWQSEQLGRPVRLPGEDEWQRLYAVSGACEVANDAAADSNRHLDHYASPCPVTRFRHGDFFDVTGNVWQWTDTPTYPFDGFDVHPIYDDFTTPTFDDRHNLIMGGSWISCGNETRRSARYAFRRHFFQHAGFRYVVSETPMTQTSAFYETDKQLSEYAEFHYGDEYFGVPNFPKALADIALAASAGKPRRSALDLGCATGRATFELAREFDQVTGIDFSARFIGLGVQLAEQGVTRYTLPDEGELISYKTRSLSDLGLDATRSKVSFSQGDACNLKPQFSGYDLILAANLIDRLYDPALFLRSVHERLQLGGILMLTSPYTWLAEHTPRDAWVGGFKKDGESYTTLDGLQALLGLHFRLLQPAQDVPFVIRETRRKHQHTVAEVTLWERIA